MLTAVVLTGVGVAVTTPLWVGEGNGLGLSICFGIIQKMGGEIDVHSIVDEGTRFDIRFPLKRPGDTKA